MATILNVDGSGNVVDVTTGSLSLTYTVVVTPAVPAVTEEGPDGEVIVVTPEVPAVTEEVTRTATELGAPTRDGCTQVILTEAQETAHAAALAQPNGGLTFDGKAFGLLPVPPPPPPPADPLIDQKAALESAITADVQAGRLSVGTAQSLQALLAAMAPH